MLLTTAVIIIGIIAIILIVILLILLIVYLNKPAPVQQQIESHAQAQVQTRIPKVDYQQIGVLTSTEDNPTILPLYGKYVPGRSDRWYYYTVADNKNDIVLKIPIKVESRDCQDIIGCNEIYDGDKVEVPSYNKKEFTATIYKFNAPRYSPN